MCSPTVHVRKLAAFSESRNIEAYVCSRCEPHVQRKQALTKSLIRGFKVTIRTRVLHFRLTRQYRPQQPKLQGLVLYPLYPAQSFTV